MTHSTQSTKYTECPFPQVNALHTTPGGDSTKLHRIPRNSPANRPATRRTRPPRTTRRPATTSSGRITWNNVELRGSSPRSATHATDQHKRQLCVFRGLCGAHFALPLGAGDFRRAHLQRRVLSEVDQFEHPIARVSRHRITEADITHHERRDRLGPRPAIVVSPAQSPARRTHHREIRAQPSFQTAEPAHSGCRHQTSRAVIDH